MVAENGSQRDDDRADLRRRQRLSAHLLRLLRRQGRVLLRRLRLDRRVPADRRPTPPPRSRSGGPRRSRAKIAGRPGVLRRESRPGGILPGGPAAGRARQLPPATGRGPVQVLDYLCAGMPPPPATKAPPEAVTASLAGGMTALVMRKVNSGEGEKPAGPPPRPARAVPGAFPRAAGGGAGRPSSLGG